jgi:hypothetical protein
MALAAEIDGQYVPLAKCDWVKFAPCGCPTGVCIASYAPTEEQAWKEFYEYARDRAKARRDGYRLELMSHERYSREVYPRMKAGCSHR